MKDWIYHQWQFFRRRSAWVYGFVVVRGVLSLFIYKIVSIFFGVSGIALFSHFQNFVGLFTQIPEQGTNLGIMRLFHSVENRRKLFFHSFLINSIVFIIVTMAVVIYHEGFLRYFDLESLEVSDLIWILLAIAFMTFNSLVISFFYAQQFFRALFWLTLVNASILVLLLYFPGSNSLTSFMQMFVMGWGINSVINLSTGMLLGYVPKPELSFNSKTGRSLLGFIIIAAGSLVFGKLVDFFVRDFSLSWFGEEQTGYWQSQVRISDSYKALFLGTFGLIFYSQLTKILDDEAKLKGYLKSNLLQGIGLVVLGLLGVFLFKKYIYLLLYTEELLPAIEFIQWQLIADAFALPSFLLIYVLVAQQRIQLFLKIHFFSAGVYILLLIVGVGWYSNTIETIPMMNVLRQVVVTGLLIGVVFYRKAKVSQGIK